MQNDILKQLEKEAIQLILREHPSLLNQLKNATITKREFTGAGFYTNFQVQDVISGEEDLQISDVGAKLNNSIQVGFLLFIKKGKLNLLECYTYADPWPDVIESYEVFTQ